MRQIVTIDNSMKMKFKYPGIVTVARCNFNHLFFVSLRQVHVSFHNWVPISVLSQNDASLVYQTDTMMNKEITDLFCSLKVGFPGVKLIKKQLLKIRNYL